MNQRARASLAGLLALAGIVRVPATAAQTLESRVTRANGDMVQMHFSARPGVCGDGRGMLRIDGGTWTSTYGNYNDLTACAAGPVRALLTKDGPNVIRIQVVAGPLVTASDASDLGAVNAAEAARYFLDLARKLEGRPARSAVLAAAIADSGDVGDALFAIAKDADKPRDLRSTALSWAARRGDSSALLRMTDGTDDPWLLGEAVDALSRANDARVRPQLRKLLDAKSTSEVSRVKVIAALGNADGTAGDAAVLRAAYPKFTERERSAALTAVANIGDRASVKWLVERARDPAETIALRRAAMQRAARAGAGAAELAALYDAVIERDLREAIVDALADDGSRAALDKLVSVAQATAADARVRRRAITKLGETGDARAKNLLQTIIDR